MKKLSIVLLLAFVFVLSLSAVALAAADDADKPELTYIELDASGVLQEGGFLQPTEPKRGGDTYAEAKAAIYAGLLEHAESINVAEFSIPLDTFNSFFCDFLNAHPDLFYVETCSYFTSNGFVTRIDPVYDESVTDEDIAAFNDSVTYIISQVETGWTDFQKYLFLHDYLVTHCEYDLTLQKHNAYDALVTGSAVCQGYALAYLYLCGLVGLTADYVSSVGINHAWNLVTLDNKQYYVDCTWDDPSNHWYEGYCKHAYFLRSRDAFGHTGNDSADPVTDWVCDGELIYGSIDGSTDYDDAWFIDVITAIPMLGSQCAYAKPNDSTKVWLCDVVSGSETGVSLEKESVWLVWDGPGYWPSNYCSLTSLNGVYYYTTPTEIWSLSKTGEKEKVIALAQAKDEAGYIYGIVNDKGTLYYNVGTRGWDTDFIRKAIEIVPDVVASGECGAEGDNLTWKLYDDGKLVISGEGAMANYTYFNTSSYAPWYSYRNSIKSVVIEDGVTSIGQRAFNHCSSLASVCIPDSVTSFVDGAFEHCSSLTSVEIPASVISIGNNAFDGCSSLTSVEIPASVTSIGEGAFYSCRNLTAIQVDANNSAYAAQEGVLFNKEKSELICCPGEKSGAYIIPASVTSIGSLAFSYCINLTSVEIPDGVASIGHGAFIGCSSLTGMEIPASVTSIGDMVFLDCDSLTSVTIPDSVTNIGDYAFRFCSRLTDVYFLGTEAQWNSITIGTNNEPLANAMKHFLLKGVCGDNLIWRLDENGVLTISGTGDMADYMGDDMPWIEFSDSITSVVIELGVTSIGDYAFADCFELTGVTIPNGVTEIGEAAFDGCESLTEITIPGSVEEIGFCAFSGCEGLTSVVIQDGVKSIDMDAFSLCSSLTEITIPASVTSIGFEAFAGCDELADVNYGGSRAQWKSIEIADGNEPLEEATIHYADSSYTPGDINGDGAVNNKDVTRLMRYIKYKDVDVVESALDVNGDGIVNNKDVTRLMRYIKYHDVEIH